MIPKFGVFIQSINQFKKAMLALLIINQCLIIHQKISIKVLFTLKATATTTKLDLSLLKITDFKCY